MEAGATQVEKGPSGTMGPSTHAYGGTRMGDNRETNVVNCESEIKTLLLASIVASEIERAATSCIPLTLLCPVDVFHGVTETLPFFSK